MKVVSTDGLTKLIQLIKSSFISNTDVVETNVVDESSLTVGGVINQRDTTTAIKTWTGTRSEYNALVSGGTVDSNTLYNITDDSNMATSILEAIYPVGSIYIGTMASCPLAALFGTWTLVAANRVLQGSGANSAGTTVEAGLPNITGVFYGNRCGLASGSGAFYDGNNPYGGQATLSSINNQMLFNASRSNSIYGNSTTVQPPAYVVNIWERTA